MNCSKLETTAHLANEGISTYKDCYKEEVDLGNVIDTGMEHCKATENLEEESSPRREATRVEVINGVECEYILSEEEGNDDDEDGEFGCHPKRRTATQIINGVECEYELSEDEEVHNDDEWGSKSKRRTVIQIIDGVECEYEVSEEEEETFSKSESDDDASADFSSDDSDTSQPDEEDSPLSDLARVARMHMASKRFSNHQESRIQQAYHSGDSDRLLHQLICEVADAFLGKLEKTIGNTEDWLSITGSHYFPGDVCSWETQDEIEKSTAWLDTFLQSTCGWPDEQLAFGPVMLPLDTEDADGLLQSASTMEDSDIDAWERNCALPALDVSQLVDNSAGLLQHGNDENMQHVLLFGTISQPISKHRLPSCNVSLAMQALRQSIKNSNGIATHSSNSSEAWLPVHRVLEQGVSKISRVRIGEGPEKQPTEEQLHFMGRLIESVVAAFNALDEVFLRDPY